MLLSQMSEYLVFFYVNVLSMLFKDGKKSERTMKRFVRKTSLRIGILLWSLVICSRFGSSASAKAMTEEEKMYKKLEIQRKKQLKRQRFALADEEGEEEKLTHGGETLDGRLLGPFEF